VQRSHAQARRAYNVWVIKTVHGPCLPQVFVWDMQAAPGSAAAVRQLKHHKEAAVAAGWSSDCCQLVTADKAGGIAFWTCQDV
jgi:hypothetical protein